MSKIHVARPHHLGLEAARAEVERIAARVRDEYGADYHWHGDVLHFKRSGLSGQIAVAEDGMDLSIQLGLLLSAMRGQIEARLTRKIDEVLARY
ncbi:MAG: polyhydroxyalkanoic acid system family protein [Lamprobacter sp.]|uniref:polyhydroxyalkanoic acid system family protein n=1 Tax=Lamprobacter sp. TaxID=3100796 RepID=UPI002B25FFC2|nr:polyhydroxyalkanoic acid system family protein [Lamprobacter sp.]MEA3639237.1 polyhydroxyalkanoic acid system family protein [Lamprobacter sp.]